MQGTDFRTLSKHRGRVAILAVVMAVTALVVPPGATASLTLPLDLHKLLSPNATAPAPTPAPTGSALDDGSILDNLVGGLTDISTPAPRPAPVSSAGAFIDEVAGDLSSSVTGGTGTPAPSVGRVTSPGAPASDYGLRSHVTPTVPDTKNPSCDDIEPNGETWNELKIEGDPKDYNGVYKDTDGTPGPLVFTISGYVQTPPSFDWTATGNKVDAVIVKGGQNGQGNVYLYNPEEAFDLDLTTPPNPNNQPAGLSHISVCYDPDPPGDDKTPPPEGGNVPDNPPPKTNTPPSTNPPASDTTPPSGDVLGETFSGGDDEPGDSQPQASVASGGRVASPGAESSSHPLAFTGLPLAGVVLLGLLLLGAGIAGFVAIARSWPDVDGRSHLR